MFRKVFSLLLCLLLIILAFCSCGSGGSDAQLVLPIDYEPEYLDPQIISDSGARMIMSNCMEGLMAYNSDGELVPAAAESYSVSSDGLTYTFKLRKDGKWRVTTAGGAVLGDDYKQFFDTRVTAKDFVFALRRAVESETKAPYYNLLKNIKNADEINSDSLNSSDLGAYAKDDYTLVIKLEKKDCDFLSALTNTVTFPCNEKYFNATGGRYGLSPSYLIYNGPFYLANWADGTSITLRKNSDYHSLGDSKINSEVKPSTVYFSFNSEQATRLKKLEDETYHVAYLTNTQANELKDSKKVNLNRFSNSLISIIFNCSDEVTSNLNLRKSLAYSFDYSVLDDYGTKATSVLPSGLTIGGESISKIKNTLLNFDTKEAGTCFTDALEELEVQKISLSVLCDTEDEQLARTIIQSWQSVFGVLFNVSVEPLETSVLKDRIKKGDYQIALYNIHYSGDIAKTALNNYASDGRENYCNFSDEYYDSLISSNDFSGSKSVTKSSIKTAGDYLTSQVVIIPLIEVETYYGEYHKCSGIVFSPTGEIAYFKNVLLS